MTPRRPAAASSASASGSAASVATAPPAAAPGRLQCDPAAAAAFEEGLHVYATASIGAAIDVWSRAVSLDATCAAANLRLGYALFLEEDWAEAKRHLAAARQDRQRLDAHDSTLLAAIEPYMLGTPKPDEAARRLRDAVAAFPSSTELWTLLARTDGWRGDETASLADADAALRLDPSYAPAHLARIATLWYWLGDFEGALAAAEQCVTRLGAIPDCNAPRLELLAELGRCKDMEAAAREWTATLPTSPDPYRALANALAARGASVESVREVLAQANDQDQGPMQRTDALRARFHLDAWAGDLTDADAALRAREEEGERRPDEHDMAILAGDRILVALESGRPGDARAVAQQLRARWDALPPASVLLRGGWQIHDASIFLHRQLRRSGLESAAEYALQRDAWLAQYDGVAPPMPTSRSFLWWNAYMIATVTPEDARAAIEALPRYLPMSRRLEDANDSFYVGRAYLLAGDAKSAVAPLERAARSCTVLDGLEPTQAHLELGRAYEATGDVDAARREYRVVVARWGAAKPRSVSAEAAKARLAALGNGGSAKGGT